jgi:hypothetical protein
MRENQREEEEKQRDWRERVCGLTDGLLVSSI